MEKKIKALTLPIETVEAILNYLATRPYQEVFTLINGLQTKGVPVFEEEVKQPIKTK